MYYLLAIVIEAWICFAWAGHIAREGGVLWAVGAPVGIAFTIYLGLWSTGRPKTGPELFDETPYYDEEHESSEDPTAKFIRIVGVALVASSVGYARELNLGTKKS